MYRCRMLKDSVRPIVGGNIRKLRKARGITGQELCRRAKTRIIGHIECGQCAGSLATIERIAKALKVPMAELFAVPEKKTRRAVTRKK